MTNEYLIQFEGDYLEKDLTKKCKEINNISLTTIFLLENKQNDFISRWVISSSQVGKTGNCDFCRKDSDLKFICHCKEVSYCSQKCKDEDLKYHRIKCKPKKIEIKKQEEQKMEIEEPKKVHEEEKIQEDVEIDINKEVHTLNFDEIQQRKEGNQQIILENENLIKKVEFLEKMTGDLYKIYQENGKIKKEYRDVVEERDNQT